MSHDVAEIVGGLLLLLILIAIGAGFWLSSRHKDKKSATDESSDSGE